MSKEGGKAVEKDALAEWQGCRRKLYSADLSTQSLDAFHSVRTRTGVEVIIDNPVVENYINNVVGIKK